jgi:2Fe-2S ferredoxin
LEAITIHIQQENLSFLPLEVPLGIELSLMEVLKGEDYPIEAICGGMAICGTCRVKVLNADEVILNGPNDDELCMLETLPCVEFNCRLSCQIKISEKIDGIKIKIPEQEGF